MLHFNNKFQEKLYLFIEYLNRKFSKYGDKDFFSIDDFPWVENIESKFSEIREELDFLLMNPDKIPNLQNIFKEEEFLCKEDKWKSFVLRIGNKWIDEHRKLCPKTCAALELIPTVKTAFFSILKSNEEIPIHRGYYSGLLRYHLALKVSEPEKCGIVVGDSQTSWLEGKSIIFDDTKFHYVWNHSDTSRVVLFVDFVRPLIFPMNFVNIFLLKCYESSELLKGFKKNSDENPFIV
jgi:ornithine lipid ester-linked acyl 2-hydroxylase